MRGAGFSCGGVELFSKEGEQGGPPGLRTIGRAFGGGVGGKESGEAREVSVEPGFKEEPGRARRRFRNGGVFEKWDEGGPVGQGPVGGGKRGRREWMRKYNLDGNIVRANGGERGIPYLTKGKQ